MRLCDGPKLGKPINEAECEALAIDSARTLAVNEMRLHSQQHTGN